MAALEFRGEVVSSWVSAGTEGCEDGALSTFIKRASHAAFTFLLATGGAVMGTFVGAMKGQTTETGFLRGGLIGAVSGAITAVQLQETMANDGESLSKVALLGRLVNEKVLMEWMTVLETSYGDISDTYDDAVGVRGLSESYIRELPAFDFVPDKTAMTNQPTCPICLEGLEEGELARKLPNCGHWFHLACIDQWLIRQGSCPICRNIVCCEEI